MKKAIYKIENLLNHKIYIGQSCRPEVRFKEQCEKKENYKSLICQAIQKYGKDNFSFEILGWFEDYNEKEKEYILFYNSKVPNGYNIMEGGENPPHYFGEENPISKITQTVADSVIKDLLNWKIPRKTVQKNNNVTSDMIRHINEGHCWKKEELNYPLRPIETELDKYRVLYIQWLCCTSDIPLNRIGETVGWKRSSGKMINAGKNHFDKRFRYPLRANKDYNLQILNQEPCIDYLHFGE